METKNCNEIKGSLEENIKMEKLNFLYKAIEDTQQIIRFTEAKIGIIFLLFGIYVSMLGSGLPDFVKYFPNMSKFNQILFIVVISLFVISIIFVANSVIMIVLPRSNPSEHVEIEKGNRPDSIFYISDLDVNLCDMFKDREIKIKPSFEGYRKKYDKITNIKDIENLLIYELLKISYLRELKIKRVRKTKRLVLFSLFLSIFLICLHFIGLYYYMPK